MAWWARLQGKMRWVGLLVLAVLVGCCGGSCYVSCDVYSGYYPVNVNAGDAVQMKWGSERGVVVCVEGYSVVVAWDGWSSESSDVDFPCNCESCSSGRCCSSNRCTVVECSSLDVIGETPVPGAPEEESTVTAPWEYAWIGFTVCCVAVVLCYRCIVIRRRRRAMRRRALRAFDVYDNDERGERGGRGVPSFAAEAPAHSVNVGNWGSQPRLGGRFGRADDFYASPRPPPPCSTPPVLDDRNQCRICMDAPLEILFMPCHHVAACSRCSPQLSTCPVCRGEIKDRQRIFL